LAVAASTFFGMSAVVSRAPLRAAGAPPKSQPHPDSPRPRWHCANAIGRACPAALQGGRAGATPTNPPVDQLKMKSATSPAN